MKIEWATVIEILIAGAILVVLHSLFGGYLATLGAKIHGSTTNGTPAPTV